MSELETLMGQSEVDLDSVMMDKSETVPAGALDSQRTRSAYTAMVSDNPEEVVNDFTLMQREFEENGTSETADRISAGYQEELGQREYSALFSVLSDTSLSEEEHRKALENYTGRRARGFDPREAVLTENLIEASQGENFEQMKVREGMAEALDAVDQYHLDAQALYLAQGAKMNSSTPRALKELIDFYIIPFQDNKVSSEQLSKLRAAQDIDEGWWDKASSLLFPGDDKLEQRRLLERIPHDQRLAMTQQVVDIIHDSSGTLLSSENHFAAYNSLRDVVGGDYTEGDAWLDNMGSILDIIPGIRALRKGAGAALKGGKGFKPIDHMRENMKIRRATSEVEPASPALTVQNVNPSKSRDIHASVSQAPNDEFAKALYGTSKGEAVADDMLPKPSTTDRSVVARTTEPDREYINQMTPDLDTLEAVGKNGAIHFSEKEKMAARTRVVHDFRDAGNLTYHQNMSQIEKTAQGVKVKAVYGGTEGGFSTLEEAREMAKLRLREYGIRNDDLTFLERKGAEYKPVDGKTPTGEGDFLVQVDYTHEISPYDIVNWEKMDAKNYIFDRIPFRLPDSFGSINRMFVDPASSNSPLVQKAASRSADRVGGIESRLIDLSEKFTNDYGSLSKARQGKVYEYIKEANHKNIRMSNLDLKARGFTDNEITTLRDWKTVWDTMYSLENADAAKSLRANGYGLLQHGENTLFARPISKDISKARVYDPQTDEMVVLTRAEMDELYEQGGTFAKMRTTLKVGDEDVERVLVRNNSDQYLRRVRDDDQVVQYRDGYYSVRYQQGSRFIEEVQFDKAGKETGVKVVGVADSIEAATLARKKLAAQRGVDPDTHYRERGDIKAPSALSDEYWDLQASQGRSAQRFRGKRLEESTAPGLFGKEDSLIEMPEEALARSIQSISQRTAMRDFIETSKQRWMASFGDMARVDKATGAKEWPTSSKKILKEGRESDADVAMARNQWEYINSLESGYVNHIDDFSKASFNTIADVLGKTTAKGEKVARAGAKLNPAQGSKGLVFNFFLGFHPLRQAVIQSHQAMRSSALNPTYWASGAASRQGSAYFATKMGMPLDKAATMAGMTKKEMKDLQRFVDDSGMLDSVDKNSLVQGALFDVADKSKGWKRKAANAVSIPRRMGFDIGEKTNLTLSMLTLYDRAKKAGKNVNDLAVRDNLYAEARILTYGMNAAGELPYNRNFLSAVLQFAQVPHKAIAQVLPQAVGGSRTISASDKAKLATIDIALFGVGTTTAASVINAIYEGEKPSPEAMEIVSQGIEGYLINNAIRTIAGDDSSIAATAALRPYDPEIFVGLAENLFGEGNMSDIVAESPIGALQGRVSDAMSESLSYTAQLMGGGMDTFQGDADLVDVTKAWLSIASGFNDTFKAMAMFETEQLLSRSGKVLDPSTTNSEAIAQLLGMQTEDTVRKREVLNKLYKDERVLRDNVKEWVKEAYRITSMSSGGADMMKQFEILKQGHRVFQSPNAKKIVVQEIKKYAEANNEVNLFERVARMSGWKSDVEMGPLIEMLPEQGAHKDRLRQFYNDLNEEGK